MLSTRGYILACFLFMGIAFPVVSQHLSLFNIDTQTYPIAQANFYAFDSEGAQITSLTRSDVVMMENSRPQYIVRVTNPSYTRPAPISVVLAVDISGSMEGRNMEIARQATRSLVRLIDLDQSESALTSFDHANYINSDFSSDFTQISKAIDRLTAEGGTNYDKAFNDELTGALQIAQDGLNKRVIIFLTDGLGTADHEQIIQKANSLGITIYCVTIDMEAPDVLKRISTGTGGTYFENIQTAEQAKQAYLDILIEAQGLEPSTVEWRSTPDCEYSKLLIFQVPSLGLENDGEMYRVSDDFRSELAVNSKSLEFENSLPGQPVDTTLIVTAINSDFELTSATSSNPAFEIPDTQFPLAVTAGGSVPITLSYESTDRKYEETRIVLNNDLCSPTVVFANNGMNNPEEVPLKVEYPNGGEVFYAGSDTTINWSGVFPWDEVKLEFSSDSARSWTMITEDARDLSNMWHIPNMISNQMLIRASLQFESRKSDLEELYYWKGDRGIEYKMSQDNSKVLYVDHLKLVILDFMTGEVLDSIKTDRTYVNAFFGSNGSRIYTWPDRGPFDVYSAVDYRSLGEIPRIENFVDFNDGITQYLRQMDNEIQIVDLETGEILKRMTVPTGSKASSYQDDLVVVVRQIDQVCEVWNIDQGIKIVDVSDGLKFMLRGTLTRDKRYLVAQSADTRPFAHNFTLTVVDIENQKELYALDMHDDGGYVNDYAGNLLLRRVDSSPSVFQVIDIPAGEVIAELPSSSNRSGMLSRDGKYIMTHSRRNGMKMFRFNPKSYAGGYGSDISDHTFSIVAPKLVAKSVDLGTVRVGGSKEQVFSSFLMNPQAVDVHVDSIYLLGGDKEAFTIISRSNNFTAEGHNHSAIEIRFEPKQSGTYSADLIIQTPFEAIKTSVKGEGIDGRIGIIDQTINLGKVNVGDAKDSLVSNVITNVGSSTVTINAIEISGPDIDQFELQSTTGFKLKKGSSKDLRIVFKPTNPGKTSTRIRYEVQDETDENFLNVFAEGVGSRQETSKAFSNDFLLSRIAKGETVLLDNVLFVQSKAVLLPESHEQLDMLYLFLEGNSEVKIELAGHTDNQGDPRLNQQLSEDRVQTIKDYLVNKGISKKRISGKGYGDTRPVASNAKEETRRLNRRVEFKIVE